MTEPDVGAERISVEQFRAAIETTFVALSSGSQVALRLAEVTEGHGMPSMEQFSLLFHGPTEPMLRQGNYELRHDTLGSMLLFLVPVLESNDERMVYEAAFARRRRSPT